MRASRPGLFSALWLLAACSVGARQQSTAQVTGSAGVSSFIIAGELPRGSSGAGAAEHPAIDPRATSSAGTGMPAAGSGEGGAAGAGSGGQAGTGAVAGSEAGAGAAGSDAGTVATRTFMLGADISDQEPAPEATRAALLILLKEHGFNAIRLRTFVDPRASDGYDRVNGYGDAAHTVAFGKQVKEAGLSLLIDIHYSDNWADPGKQCVPVSWQNRTTIEALTQAVHDYTKDLVTQLVSGGASPDMIQIGNEITPGMLLHRCDGAGQPTGDNPVTGSASNWKNLGMLLQAGAAAVREIDPGLSIALHIDRGGDKASERAGTALQASISWLTNALQYVQVDAFGLSCYQKYQGDPNDAMKTRAGWNATFAGLAAKFPRIRLFAAEYGPMQREINDVVYGLPNQGGIGTFNWEPTTRGDWNTDHDLLRRSGDSYQPQPDLKLYDQMTRDYAERL